MTIIKTIKHIEYIKRSNDPKDQLLKEAILQLQSQKVKFILFCLLIVITFTLAIIMLISL